MKNSDGYSRKSDDSSARAAGAYRQELVQKHMWQFYSQTFFRPLGLSVQEKKIETKKSIPNSVQFIESIRGNKQLQSYLPRASLVYIGRP